MICLSHLGISRKTSVSVMLIGGLLALLLVSYWFIEGLTLNNPSKDLRVRIAYKAKTSAASFDPARIKLDTEAVILDNLFSPLVRVGDDGVIEPAAAEKFFWAGNKLHFEIRSTLKTVDGISITASDAAFSLKRLLVDRENTHGDLQTFLCPHDPITSVDNDCEGIEVVGNTLILTVAKSGYRQFLLRMLANMDFGIIPKSSCDNKSEFPRITDYRNTSGPYYVKRDDTNGNFVLEANPHHWLFSTGIPKTLEFFQLPGEQGLRALQEGAVDFIPTINTSPSESLEKLRTDSNYSFFDTLPICRYFVATTPEQLNDFTDEERQAVRELVRSAFFAVGPSAGWKPADELFPALGEAGLSAKQRNELISWQKKSSSSKIHRKFTLAVSKRWMPLFSAALSSNPQIKLVELTQMPRFLPLAQRPDFYFAGTDAGFYESINLISYNMAAGFFPLLKDEGREWVAAYVSEEDKAIRIKMLQELHYATLHRGLVGVIAEAPYTAIARKPLRYEGSRFFAGSPLWTIKAN